MRPAAVTNQGAGDTAEGMLVGELASHSSRLQRLSDFLLRLGRILLHKRSALCRQEAVLDNGPLLTRFIRNPQRVLVIAEYRQLLAADDLGLWPLALRHHLNSGRLVRLG